MQAVGGALENLDTLRHHLRRQHHRHQPPCLSGTPSSSRRRSLARGAKDIRGAYGLHAREMLLWLHQLQHAREKTRRLRRHPRKGHRRIQPRTNSQLQMEGAKTGRELPGIVDQIITMQLDRLRRRRADARVRVHVSEPVGLPGQGSRRPARADREAAPRQADRQTDRPRRAQAVHRRTAFYPPSKRRSNDKETSYGLRLLCRTRTARASI